MNHPSVPPVPAAKLSLAHSARTAIRAFVLRVTGCQQEFLRLQAEKHELQAKVEEQAGKILEFRQALAFDRIVGVHGSESPIEALDRLTREASIEALADGLSREVVQDIFGTLPNSKPVVIH